MAVVLALIGVASVAVLGGCVSKTKAEVQARQAYLAGQQEASARMRRPEGPWVTLNGPVAKPSVPWSPGLTLARALVEAGYQDRKEPAAIYVVRAGRAIPIDPKSLLKGEDFPLEEGDLIEVKPPGALAPVPQR